MAKHNFNAGPCVLPKQAIEAAIEAIRDFDNTGIGILKQEGEALRGDGCIPQVENRLVHQDFHGVLIVDRRRRHKGVDQRARHIEDVAQGNGHRDAHHNRCRKEQRQLDPFADIQLAALLSNA